MMIFSSLPPLIEIVTVAGAIGVAFVSVVLLLFYCAPTWRKTKEEGKFEGIECEHEHQWTKASTEPGTSTQRIAYYGTLSLSAQNSPTRHLRSISATNPTTHFASPSHMRAPRRNSSPVAQNQIQIGTTCSRTLSPHVLDLNSYPVQPPYWDPESQQYFHCYSYDSTHASPIRSKRSSRSPTRVTHSHPPTQSTHIPNMMTTSSPAVLKRSSPPNPYGPTAIPVSGVVTGNGSPISIHTPKKSMIDYSNLFLPQPPAPMKNTLLDSFNNSPQTQSPDDEDKKQKREEYKRQGKRSIEHDDHDGGEDEDDGDKDKEDILQVVEHDQLLNEKQGKFQVILKKKQKMTIPKICSTPPEEEEMKELVSETMEIEVGVDREIRGDKKEIEGIDEELKEEKHVAEVN